MDYLLDKYVFDILPIYISPETRKSVGQRALTVVQGVLSFFGMRVPLYAILGIHHMIGYTAYVLASRMRLPWWAEGPAAGLCSVMLLLPYRIVGTKLLWWTWHDTDPTIRDRMFWVPWSMIYFHAACICSFVWIMRLSRHLLLEKEYDWTKFPREFICSLLAGSLSFWLGSVQFSLLYYPLHDFFKVHSEITTILFLSLYAVLVFSADRNNRDVEARSCFRFWFDELSCAVALEYIFLMVVIATSDPLNIVSEGLHQPIGPCSQMEDVSTPAGLVLQRAKYLCAKKYDEGYFDFHCVPNGPPKQQDDGSGNLLPLEYYAICGTDFENRAEYITVIWGSCILFASFLYQMAACSGFTPIDPVKVRSSVFTQVSKKPIALFLIFQPHRRVARTNGTPATQTSKYVEDVLNHDSQGINKFGALETPVAPNATAELPEIMGGTMTKKPTLRKRTSEVPVSTRVLRSRSHLQ
ncbi:unnamed protein product [Nippostrongylus brasiliensis]|uniref:XK-related protein n=1 Tax=Nippostrongylus brasiliensis TaxID=27835 RepID=A0A158R1G5_NIPBR|nr:unnamed protein product [Nippostrongylus brasiliensis]